MISFEVEQNQLACCGRRPAGDWRCALRSRELPRSQVRTAWLWLQGGLTAWAGAVSPKAPSSCAGAPAVTLQLNVQLQAWLGRATGRTLAEHVELSRTGSRGLGRGPLLCPSGWHPRPCSQPSRMVQSASCFQTHLRAHGFEEGSVVCLQLSRESHLRRPGARGLGDAPLPANPVRPNHFHVQSSARASRPLRGGCSLWWEAKGPHGAGEDAGSPRGLRGRLVGARGQA